MTVRLAAIERVVRGGLLVLPRGPALVHTLWQWSLTVAVEPLVVVGVDGCCRVDIRLKWKFGKFWRERMVGTALDDGHESGVLGEDGGGGDTVKVLL